MERDDRLRALFALVIALIFALAVVIAIMAIVFPPKYEKAPTLVAGVRGLIFDTQTVGVIIAGTLGSLGLALAAIFNFLTKTHESKSKSKEELLSGEEGKIGEVCPFHPDMVGKLDDIKTSCTDKHSKLEKRISDLEVNLKSMKTYLRNSAKLNKYSAEQLRDVLKRMGHIAPALPDLEMEPEKSEY